MAGIAIAITCGALTFCILIAEVALIEYARSRDMHMRTAARDALRSVAAGLLGAVALMEAVAIGRQEVTTLLLGFLLILTAFGAFFGLVLLESCHHSVGAEEYCRHEGPGHHHGSTRSDSSQRASGRLEKRLRRDSSGRETHVAPMDSAVCCECTDPDAPPRPYSDLENLHKTTPPSTAAQRCRFATATALWMAHGFVDGVAIAFQTEPGRALLVALGVTFCGTLDVVAFSLFIEGQGGAREQRHRRTLLVLFAAQFPVGIAVSSWIQRIIAGSPAMSYVAAATAGCLVYIAVVELFPGFKGGAKAVVRNLAFATVGIGLALLTGAIEAAIDAAANR